MTCTSGKVKHVCCRVCLFIVVLALEQHTIPSVLAQESTSIMSWGVGGPKLELHIGEPPAKPSLVALLVNDVPWTDSRLPRQSGRFSVRAPRGQGLMAVIQILNLRADRSAGGNVCRDFIRLTDVSSGVQTSPICGELQKENKSFIPEYLIGPRVFHSPSGKMDISYESDRGDDSESSSSDRNESRAKSRHVVEIVFSAYESCIMDKYKDQVKCGDQFCISQALICDEHINCGFQEDFAVDEVNCTYTNYGRNRSSGGNGKPPYLVTLYLGAFLFIIIIAGIAFYHRHTTYQRIKNIPT